MNTDKGSTERAASQGRRDDPTVPHYLPPWPTWDTTKPGTTRPAAASAAASHYGRSAVALLIAAGAGVSVATAVGAGPAIAMALGIAAALGGRKRPPQQPNRRKH